MKRLVRTVWISTLSGMAFLTACCTQNGLTRRERKQLMKEREQVEMQLAKVKSDRWENTEEGDPNYYQCYWLDFMLHFDEKYALENKLDSINYRLGEDIDLDRNIRRRQILKRIDSLTVQIKGYIPPCVYGPPPGMYPDYDEEQSNVESDLSIWERQLEEAKTELDDLDRAKTQGPEIYEALYGVPVINYDDSQQVKEQQLQEAEQRKLDSIQRKNEMLRKRDSIRQARRNNDRSCVYGPPPSPSPSTCGVSNADVKSTTTKLNDLVNDWSMASTPAEKAEKKASFDAIVKSFDAKLNEADCRKLDPKLLKNYEFVKKLIK